MLAHGLLVFFATGGIALAAAARVIIKGGYVPSAGVSVPYFLAVFLLATLLLILTLKTIKNPIVFESLFALAMLSGVWFIADIYLPPGVSLLAGSLVILARFRWKSVFFLNTTLSLGIAGIAASLALGLSPNAVVLLLVALSIYDIVAVYRTKHMVRMFRDLASRGVVSAFALTPITLYDLSGSIGAERRGMLLGTGDVALPVMLAVSALRIGPVPAVAAMAGAALGFALMFMLFLAQPKRAPMPALPPIALGSILAYFVSLIIFHS